MFVRLTKEGNVGIGRGDPEEEILISFGEIYDMIEVLKKAIATPKYEGYIKRTSPNLPRQKVGAKSKSASQIYLIDGKTSIVFHNNEVNKIIDILQNLPAPATKSSGGKYVFIPEKNSKQINIGKDPSKPIVELSVVDASRLYLLFKASLKADYFISEINLINEGTLILEKPEGPKWILKSDKSSISINAFDVESLLFDLGTNISKILGESIGSIERDKLGSIRRKSLINGFDERMTNTIEKTYGKKPPFKQKIKKLLEKAMDPTLDADSRFDTFLKIIDNIEKNIDIHTAEIILKDLNQLINI